MTRDEKALIVKEMFCEKHQDIGNAAVEGYIRDECPACEIQLAAEHISDLDETIAQGEAVALHLVTRVQELERALKRIRDEDEFCHCASSADPDCCNRAEEWCPHCIAHAALRTEDCLQHGEAVLRAVAMYKASRLGELGKGGGEG